MIAVWTTAPLGELCDISIGRTPSRAEPKYWGRGHRWLSIADMNQGEDLYRTKEEVTDCALRECNCRMLAPGTLVMSFKLSVGKIGFVREAMCTNEAIAALPIRDARRVEARFLYRALQVAPLLRDADRAVKGLTLNSEKLARVPISYPTDVREQRRIAGILDKADAIRRKRKEAIALTEELLRSAFLEMFGDPVTNPKGWPLKRVSELGQVTTGNTPSRAVPAFYGDDIEWIKSDNINTQGHILTRAHEGLSAEGRAVGRTAPPGSTLMTCIAGSPACIGNVALADREVAFNQQINAITPRPGVDRRFLYVLFLAGKRLVQAASTNSMKGMVSKGKLEEVLAPAPPPDLQRRFGETFDRVIRMSEQQEHAEHEAGQLFESLVQRAFRGELAASAGSSASHRARLGGDP